MLKKPMTLTDFIYAEMNKFHIENNSKNLKNLRNEVNHLLATNPLLKKEKNKLAPLTDPKDARKKLYPASLWNKVEKNEKFKKYALKHANPTYNYADISWFLKHIKYTTNKNLIMPENKTNIHIKPIFGKEKVHKDIDITYVLLNLIFSKLYPNQHINITSLQEDLEKIKNKKTDRNEYIKAYNHLTDLTNYLIPTDKKDYMKKLTETSPNYLLTRMKEIK